MLDQQVDIIKLEDGSDCYEVVLVGYRRGGCPGISKIAWGDVRSRLEEVLGLPKVVIDGIRKKLDGPNRQVTERIGKPTIEQLRAFGFEGL